MRPSKNQCALLRRLEVHPTDVFARHASASAYGRRLGGGTRQFSWSTYSARRLLSLSSSLLYARLIDGALAQLPCGLTYALPTAPGVLQSIN